MEKDEGSWLVRDEINYEYSIVNQNMYEIVDYVAFHLYSLFDGIAILKYPFLQVGGPVFKYYGDEIIIGPQFADQCPIGASRILLPNYAV
jgi:hypothetical protein